MLDNWYTLLTSIEDDQIPLEVRNWLKGHFKRLLEVLLRHSMFEEGVTDDEEELYDFLQFRSQLNDTYQYCYSALGEDYFNSLLEMLEAQTKYVTTRSHCYLC